MSDKEHNNKSEQVAISRRLLGGESPIILNELTDRCLYSGFFGILDSVRMKNVIDAIMAVTERNDHDIMIIDLSNVEVIDSAVSANLKKLNKLLQLVGMTVIFCSIKPIVAASMIRAGIELDRINVEKNIKRALKAMYAMQGLKLVTIV